MSSSHEVELLGVGLAAGVPGRGERDDVDAIAEALGCADPDPAVFLAEGLLGADNDAFVSRFLSELLLRPPIPAGCVALMHRIQAGELPWLTHEVLEDRVGLWTAHAVAHHVAPDAYPAPSVPQIQLLVRPQLDRSLLGSVRGRTLWAAQALSSAPGWGEVFPSPVEPWAFDTLWYVEASTTEQGSALDIRGSFPQDALPPPHERWRKVAS